ncbi:MAG: hypothetical protein WBD27_02510 [Pyrinomonadaceae bacterium]
MTERPTRQRALSSVTAGEEFFARFGPITSGTVWFFGFGDRFIADTLHLMIPRSGGQGGSDKSEGLFRTIS